MKIDLASVDRENFMVHEHFLNGEIVYLIQPVHIGVKWQKETLIFRSSVWNVNGELISGGFKKFFNWSEQPDISPLPSSLKNTTIVEKIDGSLLIVSKYKSNYIFRTRGTVDASKLDNGSELELFKETILTEFTHLLGTQKQHDMWDFSILFEWVSPNQRIILNYGDSPEWYLVGMVFHDDYRLQTQRELDGLASACHLKRPPVYTFPSIADLMSGVETWKGKEGVVVYSNNDQTLHKIKAFEYLSKHRFKSEATLENTLELYFSMGKPSYVEFEKKLIEAFDYECFEMVRGFISIICDANKEVEKIIKGMGVFVRDVLLPLPTRRDQAQKVLESYSITNRASMVFVLLDGKILSEDQMKKLFWQVLKK